MHTNAQRPPGHPEPQAERLKPALAAADGALLPSTPLRCQAADGLVALTSTSVLAIPRRQQELVGLPLGAVLSPTPSKSLPSYALDPATCTSCGAYINVYAPASGDRGEWHCNFCLHLNSSSVGAGSGGGSTPLEPAGDHSPAGPAQTQPPHSAYITPPTMSSLGPSAGAGATPATPLTPLQPPLQQEAVDYISPGPSPVTPGPGTGLPGSWSAAAGGTGAGEGVTVLVVDLLAAPADLDTVREALLRAARALPGAAHVALVTCDTTVQAYRLGGQQATDASAPLAVACDVVPGDVEAGADEALLHVLRAGVHVAQARQCRGVLLAALKSLRPHSAQATRPRCIPGAVQTALHLSQLPHSAAAAGSQDGELDPRDLHAASVNGAQQLAGVGLLPGGVPQAQQMDRGEGSRPPSHVVVVTTGKAPLGYSPLPGGSQPAAASNNEEGSSEGGEEPSPGGSVQLARHLGRLANRAALAGVTLDILAAGVDQDHIPALAPLAQGTAGLFVQHRLCDDFFAANITSAVRRPAGLTASLEVRTSGGLAVRDTYGAVVPLFAAGRATEQWEALTGGASLPPSRWLNRRTWHYRCGPPSDSSGVTLVLQCDRAPMQTYTYLQVVWRWVDEGGHRVQRIITRRLHTAQNPTAVVESLNPGVCAVVWAKTLVAQALERGAAYDRKETEILRRSLGRRLFEFVSLHCFPVEASRGWFSGPTRYLLPSALLPIAQTLYCLHRGPMLHHGLAAHPEERALLQAHFMTASLGLSQNMCTPVLHLLTHLPITPTPAESPRDAASTNGTTANGSSTTLADVGADPPPSPGLPKSPLPSLRGPLRFRGEELSLAPWHSCFADAPAADLALYDSPAAVLDYGSHMHVWLAEEGLSGEERSAAEAQCRRFALGLGAERVPVPELVVDSRQLVARLMPIRQDPHHQQVVQAPLLAGVSRGLLEMAAARLGPTQEPSLYQWLQQHGVEPDQGPAAGAAAS